MGNNQPLVSFVLLILFLPLFSPLATADNLPEQPQINANWVANELGETLHAYRVLFADGESYQATVNVEHNRDGLILPNDIFQSWDLIDGLRVLDIELNTTIEWGDIVTVTVSITHYAGQELENSLLVEREFEVGTWTKHSTILLDNKDLN